MRKKRLFCALLALSLALGCCGCGKGGSDPNDLRAEAVRTTAAENVDRFVAEKISVDGWGEDFCLIDGEAVFLLGQGESKSLCAMGTDGENLRTLAALDLAYPVQALSAGVDGRGEVHVQQYHVGLEIVQLAYERSRRGDGSDRCKMQRKQDLHRPTNAGVVIHHYYFAFFGAHCFVFGRKVSKKF